MLLKTLTRQLKKGGFGVQAVLDEKAMPALKTVQAAMAGQECVFSTLPAANVLSVEDCEKILNEAGEQTGLFVCVGGANACAYGKYVAAKTGKQWIMLAVLPNSDDFAANHCMLWQDGIKRVLPGRAPDVLLCDFDLAFKLSAGLDEEGVALALRNVLAVFDNVFAYAVQGGTKCNVANYVLTTCVSDALSLAGMPFSKEKATKLMTCLLRVSLAKSLCKASTQYLSSAHALTFALQTKHPEYAEGALALPVCDVLTKVFAASLESDCRLLVEKDGAGHADEAKAVFGADVQAASQPNNEEAFENNRAAFAKNLQTAQGVVSVALKNGGQKVAWGDASACLRLCTDVYAYGGMLSYLCDKGYLEGV